MGLVLDSSVLIAAERGRFDIAAFVEAEAAMETIFIAAITASELLHGVHRASAQRRKRRETYVEALISETPPLAFDLGCARHHAKLWAELEIRGERIGPHDMMIAATCLTYGHRLATLNEAEFSRVEGLVLANARKYCEERQ
jgi:tRNA(fMet)-specific endonuclease VapC